MRGHECLCSRFQPCLSQLIAKRCVLEQFASIHCLHLCNVHHLFAHKRCAALQDGWRTFNTESSD